MKKRELLKLLTEFCKSKDLHLTDIRENLKDIVQELYSIDDEEESEEYNPEDPLSKRFYEFHKHLVQETIDYVNSDPDLLELIDKKRKEIETRMDYPRFPLDLSVNFGIDCLDPSLKEGEWTPYSDSSFGVYLGIECVKSDM